MITAEQAHVIFDIYRELGIGLQWFNPKALYSNGFHLCLPPAQAGEAERAAIDELVQSGLLEQNKNKSVRLTERALHAYDEWVQARRFERMRRVWFKSGLGGACSVLITVTGPIEQARLEKIMAGDPDFMGISMV